MAVVRFLALSYVMAAVAAVMSERVFWFWTSTPLAHLELSAFYGIATAAVVLVIGRFEVDSLWSLLLVAPVFGYIVEGALTPVVYTGGPFVPFFPVWFGWWHGVMSLVFLVFMVRSWLLTGSMLRLVAASVGTGLFWGVWASTLWLPENVGDEELLADLGELVVLGPAAFAQYAAVFTIILMAAHWALGFVWPAGGPVSAAGERVVGGLVLVAVIGWTLVVPWALPMFVAYMALQWMALRWHRSSRHAGAQAGPDLFAQLQGVVPWRNLLGLVPIAPVAAGVYWLVWQVDPSDLGLRFVMYGTIVVQTVLGGVVLTMALLRARRRRPPRVSTTPYPTGPAPRATIL